MKYLGLELDRTILEWNGLDWNKGFFFFIKPVVVGGGGGRGLYFFSV